MTTAEIAKDFTEMLKRGEMQEAASKYNSDDIVSIEAMDGPMRESKGKAALKAKGEWWQSNHEVHSGSVVGPYVNGDEFVVHFTYDVTVKESGQKLHLDEVGLYKVEGGKIVEEKFYYFGM